MEKGKWISAKIRELEHENKGRSHEQNIAIAFSMWNDRKEDGGEQLPQYQDAGWGLGNLKPVVPKKEGTESNVNAFGFPVTGSTNYNIPGAPNIPTGKEWVQQATGKNEFGFPVNVNPNYGKPVTASNNNPNWGKSVTATADSPTFVEPTVIPEKLRPTVTPLTNRPTKQAQTVTTRFQSPISDEVDYIEQVGPEETQQQKDERYARGLEGAMLTDQGNEMRQSNLPEYQEKTVGDEAITEKYLEDEASGKYDINNKKMQFFNPYGGIDLETSLVGLGQGIQRGDTKAIVGNSLLAGLKGARNVMGGMGLANRENQVMQDYWDQQRQGMIGNATVVAEDGGYFQDGGAQKIKNPDGSYSMRTTHTTSTPGTQGYTIPGQPGVPAVLPSRGVNSTDEGRNKVFAEARRSGKNSFMYNGKLYSTEMSGTPGKPAANPTPDVFVPGLPPTFSTSIEEQPLYAPVFNVEATRGTIGGERLPGVLGSQTTDQQYTSNPNVGQRTLHAADVSNANIEKVYGQKAQEFNPRGYSPAVLAKRNTKMQQRYGNLQNEASVEEMQAPMGLERAVTEQLRDDSMQFKPTQQNQLADWKNGGYFQEGGEQFQNPQEGQVEGPQGQNTQEEGQEQQGGQQQQMMQQIAQAIQGGAQPEQVVQKLIESGIPQEQAIQMVQAVVQQLQQPQGQQQAPQEQPQMKNGGEYLSLLKGKRIKDYKLDPKTNMYTVEYE